jgi:hypothetical protein
MDNENPYAASPLTSEAPTHNLTYKYPRRRMRFWRVERLKAEMRAQPLSERESLPYLVVYVAFFTIASGFPNPDFNLLDAIGSLLSVVITIVGTVLIYQQNGGIDGRFFLQRYFAIGFVVAMRCLVAIVGGMLALLAALDSLGMSSDETTLYDLVFIGIAEIIVYWRIAYHIRDLAESAPQSQSVAEPCPGTEDDMER